MNVCDERTFLNGVDISSSNVELCHSIGLTNVICGDILKEIREMHFDKIIMNPPYNIGSKIIDKIKGKAEETVILAPLSNFKHHKNYKYVNSFEIVDNTVFGAIITPNLGVACFSNREMSNKQWEDLQFLTFDQRMVPIYKRNIELGIKYEIYEDRYRKTTDFDFNKDFIEGSRLPNGGDREVKANGYKKGNNIGYKVNTLKQIPEELTSNISVINFNTPLEKDNFTTWVYTDNPQNCLANRMIWGLHLNTTSKVCSMAIPQIDWEIISDDELWREGKYDKAVLKAMGFTEEDIEKLV